MGLTAGIVVTLYRVVLSQAERLLRTVAQFATTSPLGMLYHVGMLVLDRKSVV